MPLTATSSNGPEPVPTGETPASVYASASRIASCGLESRWGSSGSGVAVVMTTPSPSAVTVSLVPFRMRGRGTASIACCSELTTVSGVSVWPLWKVTPVRIAKRQVSSSVRSHSVARLGSAAPASSSTTRVSAVAQRDSLNASSLKGVSPDRGGCSMAIEIRAPASGFAAGSAEPGPPVVGAAKQPDSSRPSDSGRAAKPRRLARAETVMEGVPFSGWAGVMVRCWAGRWSRCGCSARRRPGRG